MIRGLAPFTPPGESMLLLALPLGLFDTRLVEVTGLAEVCEGHEYITGTSSRVQTRLTMELIFPMNALIPVLIVPPFTCRQISYGEQHNHSDLLHLLNKP
jgi:hypothetical protein